MCSSITRTERCSASSRCNGWQPGAARPGIKENSFSRVHHSLFLLLRLVAYLAASSVFGALLAFPVYLLLSGAGEVEFDSVLRRTVSLAALLFLPLYLGRSVGMDREALGFACAPRSCMRSFVAGFGLGILAVTPLLLAFLMLDIRALTLPAIGALSEVAAYAAFALFTAVVIGVVEEAYFRGALLAPLWPMSAWLAVPVVSLVYAAAHFVGGPIGSDDVAWFSGLASIGRTELPLDAFLALFAAGLLLGAVRYRCGHIALGAGLHAGWVWLMKLNQEYGDVDPGSDLLHLAGSYGGTMGYLGLAWIALLGACWFMWVRRTGSGAIR